MREKIAHALLALFVVTLSASSMLLADKYVDLQAQVPGLQARIALLETTPKPMPTPTPTPLPIPTNAPHIETLTPTAGKAGTIVTATGVDFLPSGNDVMIGKTWIASVPSKTGTSLRFTIPLRMVECSGEGNLEICKIRATSTWAGTSLPVWIRNAQGVSNRMPFLIKK